MTDEEAYADAERVVLPMFAAARAMADGADPADFPKYGFDPGVERLVEIFREVKLKAVE